MGFRVRNKTLLCDRVAVGRIASALAMSVVTSSPLLCFAKKKVHEKKNPRDNYSC